MFKSILLCIFFVLTLSIGGCVDQNSDSSNSSSESNGNQNGGTTQNDNNPPAAPSGVNLTPGDHNVVVSWQPSAKATEYRVYAAKKSGVRPNNYSTLDGGVVFTGAISPFTVPSLANETKYYFVVTAVNGYGQSEPSSEMSATPSYTYFHAPLMPVAKANFAIVVLDGKIYIIGGNNLGYTPGVEIYDPVLNSWSEGPSITSRTDLSSAVVDGVIYAIGGMQYVNNVQQPVKVAYSEIFDGISYFWSRAAGLPSASYRHTSVAIGSSIYTLDGGSIVKLSTLDFNTSVLLTPLISPGVSAANGSSACSVAINDLMYISGGTNRPAQLGIYDPALNEWRTGASLPTPRSEHTCVAVNNKIYVFGGVARDSNNIEYLPAAVDIYDPSKNTWATASRTITPRRGLRSAAIGERIFVFGGYNSTYLPTVEIFDVAP